MKDFSKFQMLFIPHDVKILSREQKLLEKEAMKWFKEHFIVVFGSTTRCDTKDKITFHYSVGLLTFGFPGLGDYYYKFLFKMIHFEKWQLKEWKEGFAYGKYCSKSKMKLRDNNYRDGNPYKDFYRNEVWDCGYMMGLYNFSFKEALAKKQIHNNVAE